MVISYLLLVIGCLVMGLSVIGFRLSPKTEYRTPNTENRNKERRFDHAK